MARASKVLAVDPSIFGSMLTLPTAQPELFAFDAHQPVMAMPRRHRAGAADVPDGSLVAVVTIDGPLAQRGEVHLCGYLDGYDWIADRFQAAISDPKVGSVVLRINSPGGDAAGLEEAVKRMRAAAKSSRKRVIAFADELAASAAYWIAAGVADEVWLPPSGEVGSIGTLAAWVDATEQLQMVGLKVHMVRDPEGKAAMHPFAPVAEVADERMAQCVEECTARFVAAVSKRRKVAESKVRKLDGDVLRGEDAVAFKLADSVGSYEQALARASSAAREKSMGTKERQALGVSEEATDQDIERAGEERELGAWAVKLTEADSPAGARGKIQAWKEGAAETAELRVKLDAAEAANEKGELSAFLLSKVGKKLTPAQAWAKDDDGLPQAGEPHPRWTKMGLAEAQAFIEESPSLKLSTDDPETPKTDDGLTEQQRAIADELKMTSEQRSAYARRLAAKRSN